MLLPALVRRCKMYVRQPLGSSRSPNPTRSESQTTCSPSPWSASAAPRRCAWSTGSWSVWWSLIVSPFGFGPGRLPRRPGALFRVSLGRLIQRPRRSRTVRFGLCGVGSALPIAAHNSSRSQTATSCGTMIRRDLAAPNGTINTTKPWSAMSVRLPGARPAQPLVLLLSRGVGSVVSRSARGPSAADLRFLGRLFAACSARVAHRQLPGS